MFFDKGGSMRYAIVLCVGLLLQVNIAALELGKANFIQRFNDQYLAIVGEGLPICLKVSNRKIRAVNQQGVCARLQRASIRQNGEVCVKPNHPGASARCESVNVLDDGRLLMGEGQRPIWVYASKQALLQALKSNRRGGIEDPLGKPIEE